MFCVFNFLSSSSHILFFNFKLILCFMYVMQKRDIRRTSQKINVDWNVTCKHSGCMTRYAVWTLLGVLRSRQMSVKRNVESCDLTRCGFANKATKRRFQRVNLRSFIMAALSHCISFTTIELWKMRHRYKKNNFPKVTVMSKSVSAYS